MLIHPAARPTAAKEPRSSRSQAVQNSAYQEEAEQGIATSAEEVFYFRFFIKGKAGSTERTHSN